jgi:uncharacterized RDD family membrane protein YckC
MFAALAPSTVFTLVCGTAAARLRRGFGLAEYPLRGNISQRRIGDIIFWTLVVAAAAVVIVLGLI